MAGYHNPDNIGAGTSQNFFFRGNCGGLNPCTADQSEVAALTSDRIAIEFDPPPDDGTEVGCTGAAVGAAVTIANVYFLDTVDDVSSLYCRTYNIDTGAWLAAAQPLVDGVDAMQVLYGVSDEAGVQRYVSADRVTDWFAVRTVRLSLLVSNGSATGLAAETTRNYVVLDAPTLSFTDRFIRHIYGTTVQIGNWKWEGDA